jgi:ankyrin repeat protein
MEGKDGNTLLHFAAAKPEQIQVLKKLIAERSDDINAQNKDGNTPLHVAFLRNNLEAVAALLGAKPNVHIINNEGNTPFDLFKE